jgi:hypothetical protein
MCLSLRMCSPSLPTPPIQNLRYQSAQHQPEDSLITSNPNVLVICRISTPPSSFSNAISITVKAVSTQFKIVPSCVAIASPEKHGARVCERTPLAIDRGTLGDGLVHFEEGASTVSIASVPWTERWWGPMRTTGPSRQKMSVTRLTVFLVHLEETFSPERQSGEVERDET